jgi:hypothetical protein
MFWRISDISYKIINFELHDNWVIKQL